MAFFSRQLHASHRMMHRILEHPWMCRLVTHSHIAMQQV